MEETLGTGGRLELRTAGPSEAADLQGVFEAAGDHFLRMTGRPEPPADAADRELRSAGQAPGRAVALVIDRDTRAPVGALGWWAGHPEPEVALLGMLMIIPERRREGLAREALGLLESSLRQGGIRRLRTGVAAADRELHELLRALGFSAMDERKHVEVDQGRLRIALFEKAL